MFFLKTNNIIIIINKFIQNKHFQVLVQYDNIFYYSRIGIMNNLEIYNIQHINYLLLIILSGIGTI